MKFFYTMALCLTVAITLYPQHIEADIAPAKPLSPKETIVKYAREFAAPEKELLVVSFCESSFNPKAVGDKGAAHNIFQYHRPTFDRFSQEMGENLDYNSYDDQAKLTAWVFKNRPQYKKHWTCWTNNFKQK